MNEKIDIQTISDFGTQWTKYTDNSGYYGSTELLNDIIGPLLDCQQLKGKRVAEIGSGTGRIVKMLLNSGAEHVTAIEPSNAYYVLQKNLEEQSDKVNIIHDRGEAIAESGKYDIIFSIGVLHHITDPSSIVRAAYKALKPGGKLIIWVYGYEGNRLYLVITNSLRFISKKLPHKVLSCLSSILCLFTDIYGMLCGFLPLPLKQYFLEVFNKVSRSKRKLIIYDQLNPAYAKYYKKSEVTELMSAANFNNVDLYHRHEYSWTAMGQKPHEE